MRKTRPDIVHLEDDVQARNLVREAVQRIIAEGNGIYAGYSDLESFQAAMEDPVNRPFFGYILDGSFPGADGKYGFWAPDAIEFIRQTIKDRKSRIVMFTGESRSRTAAMPHRKEVSCIVTKGGSCDKAVQALIFS